MAIPTWRNVGTPNFGAANQLLTNAGNQLTQGISQLGSAVNEYDTRQQNADAQAFDQSLSAGIGQFGGDQQAYKDFVTQQVAGNTNLTGAERVTAIDNATKEYEATLGLTDQQNQQVAEQKATDARGLEDLQFNQQTERNALQSQLGYPLERFDWKDDKSVNTADVEKEYAHLENSGLNVKSIKDTIAKRLGRTPSGKELQGIIVDAAGNDYSLFNENSVEVVNGFWAGQAGTDLNSVIDKYKEGITQKGAAQKVRDLNRSQEDSTNALTKRNAANISAFGKNARSQNASVRQGNTRQSINF